jgi:hypothetical protein
MAVAAKGKAPASDSFMTPDKMKPLLALSKSEPVQAAIGLTADGEGVILLDKKRKSKQVLALLKSTAAKQKIQLQPTTLRFGKAEVDTEYDPGMVRFFVNKDPPGNMRAKLVEVVKRIPYQKVELNVDVSLEDESEEDETQTEEAPTQAQQPASQRPPVPPMNAGMLERLLAELARRIGELPADQTALKPELHKLATDANAAIKAGSLDAARGLMVRLRDALDHAGRAANQPDGAATQARTAPGTDFLAVFRDAKEEVDEGLNKLARALRETRDVDLVRIADYGLYGMTEGQGVGLMKALLDLKAASPDRREALAKDARAAAAAYKAAVFADKAVDLVDANPFGIEVGIRAKLGTALDTIATAA